MTSKYTIICVNCGRRNTKSISTCVNCGSQIELPVGGDNYISEIFTRNQFGWYHNLGIEHHRWRGLTRGANGLGIILVGVFFLFIFPLKLGHIGVAALIVGLGMLPVAVFEIIANRSFASIPSWGRWLILLFGTFLVLCLALYLFIFL